MTEVNNSDTNGSQSSGPKLYRVEKNGDQSKYVDVSSNKEEKFKPNNFFDEIPDEEPAQSHQSSFSKQKIWGRFFIAGLIGLILIEIGVQIYGFVYAISEMNSILRLVSSIFLLLLIAGLLGLIIREWIALKSLKKIDKLRREFETALNKGDQNKTKKLIAKLIVLYSGRPNLKDGREQMTKYLKSVIVSSDLIRHAESNLLEPLDQEVQSLIMQSAKRVSLFTAVNSRVSIEFLIVLAENLRLIRKILELYGGRPSISSSYRLTRNVIANLFTAVGLEAGGTILTDILGQGILSKISKGVGEGLVNGMLTIRIGYITQEICRPCPFSKESKPRISRFFSLFSTSFAKKVSDEDDSSDVNKDAKTFV